MSGVIDVLYPFYTTHYNFGVIAILILLVAAWLGSKKNIKGAIAVVCIFLVYNLVMYKKTKRDPEWYEKKETQIKNYDPVKKLWEDKSADDDPDKRK